MWIVDFRVPIFPSVRLVPWLIFISRVHHWLV